MKRTLFLNCWPALCLCVVMACKPSEPASADKKEEKSETKRLVETTNGEVVLKLDAETQARMGLKVEALIETTFTPEIKAFGRVIDPAPLNTALNEIAVAKATLSVSEKELERLKVLRQQNNTSERALQTGEAAFQRDKLTLQAAVDKLQLTWGKQFAQRADLANIAQTLAAGDRSLVRIDQSNDGGLTSMPNHIRVSLFSETKTAHDAEFVGAATSVDPATQRPGFLFLANAGYDKLPVGSVITGVLASGAPPMKGVRLPGTAVLVHDGVNWFYEQKGDTEFQRRPLEKAVAADDSYFLTNGGPAAIRVVIVGAQQLLSEELKSQLKAD